MTQKQFDFFKDEVIKIHVADAWEIQAMFSELGYQHNLYFDEEKFLEDILKIKD